MLNKRLKGFCYAVLSTLAMSPLYAGNSWFSQVHTVTLDGAPIGHFSGALNSLAVASAGDSTNAVFDIVISLEADPQGDDDATVDDGANDTDQRKYEAIVKELADGVCQSTNTAHKLGVVRIFRNLEQKDSADILWNATCAQNRGPRANPSGFGKSGHKIWMCDNWPGAGGFNPLVDNPKPAGFTLAHEWGHYAYGLYDEYVAGGTTGADYLPRSTDTQSSPSLMHDQWCAAGGGCPSGFTSPDLDFLEFSTSQVAPFNGTGTNAQKRVYGISGWDALVQDTASDPKVSYFPSRTRYTNLAAVTPPSGTDYTVNDSEANCRDSLDIRWMQSDIIYEILLDRSGSMDGTLITNAKTAANLLIDQLQEGNAALGIASFSDSAVQNYSISDIPDPDTGIKSGAKAAVNGLFASGFTALFDGLVLALNNVESFASATATPNRAKVVFVLSDGVDNSSSATEDGVITSYDAADVPIITFGYGANAPSSSLQSLAAGTGGQFFFSPTTLAEIQQAFTAANSAVSSSATLSSSTVPTSASSTTSQTVPVDSTIGELLFSLIYGGAPGDMSFSLLDPVGTDTGIVFSCETTGGGTVSCAGTLDEATIAAHSTGDYTLVHNNVSTVDVTVATIITGTPAQGGDTYDVVIAISGGATVNYPHQARITAIVSRNLPITGLVVTANVTGPGGATTAISMVDDGTNVDNIADDGTYSALINYTENGNHAVQVTVDNSAGTGVETTAGALISHSADGSPLPPPGLTDPVTENFSRSATIQFEVAGVLADDHANNPAGGTCTLIVDNNADTPGRIDFAADVDCFSVVPSDPAADLVFRVTGLSNSMDPVLQVYDSVGILVVTIDMVNSENSVSGAIGTIPAANQDLAGMNFSVSHSDPTATTGGYDVSVGPAIHSDTPVQVVIALESSITKLDIKYKGKNQLKGDVKLKANVALDDLPDDSDVIAVMVDGIELYSTPFSELKGSHSFEYKSKNSKVKLVLNKGVLDVYRKKVGLTGLDNSDGVDVEIRIGDAVSVENVVLMSKGSKKKLSYKLSK